MGFLLLVPFFLVRFWFMSWLDLAALPRAAHFPPLRGGERAASLPLRAALGCFQISAQRIIRAEECRCRENFGESYRRYAEMVRRYL